MFSFSRILFVSGLYFFSVQMSSLCSAQNIWNDEEKKIFYDSCMEEAGMNMTDNASRYYCECVVAELVRSFPDPYDTLITELEIERISDSCIVKTTGNFGDLTYKMNWDEQSKNSFLQSCRESMPEVPEAEVNEYCSCVLSKVIISYPDPQFISRIDEEEIEKIMKECR